MEKKELIEALESVKNDIFNKQEEIKSANEENVKSLKADLEKIENDKKAMQAQLDELATKQKNAEKVSFIKKEESETFAESLKSLLNSDEFKEARKKGFPKDSNKFEVKVDTSVITGDVNRTQQRLDVNFAPENQLAFINNMRSGFVGADKNRVLWVDGAYTSNVGYVSEGTGSASADTATATEKTREMAKISAKLPLTAEMLEDADYLTSAFRMKMNEKAQLFVDGEAYDGDGSDGTYPKHIYGIKGHATAFNATTAGVATSVENANIGDLVDAMILQAEKENFRGSNILWMNPTDFYKFKTTKDQDGNYIFVKDVNGNYNISGVRVIRSNRVTAGDLLLADTSKLQYWTKRNAEIKFSQMNGTDFIDDAYTAVMFVRSQVVVETQDKKSLIFVDDIDTAINAIQKV